MSYTFSKVILPWWHLLVRNYKMYFGGEHPRAEVTRDSKHISNSVKRVLKYNSRARKTLL